MPGLVQQQGVHVAGRLDGPTAHGQDVALDQPIHPRDADGRQQRADRRRDQADEQCDEDDDRLLGLRVDGEGLQGDDREQEDDREAGQKDREGDLVRRLLPARSLDQRDHPVQEGLAGLGRDLDRDLVREDPGPSRDRGAITAALPDDRRRLARDGRLVDGGEALDHVAVAGDHLARDDDAQVTDLQRGGGLLDQGAVGLADVGHGLGPGPSERGGLRLASPFRHRFGEVREEHGEPQPERHHPGKDVLVGRRRADVPEEQDGGQH